MNTATFTRLYQDSVGPVYNYFYWRCGCDREVAEDLTQETFIAAVSRLKGNVPVTEPGAWILGIARHKLMDHYRKGDREQRKMLSALQAKSLEEVSLNHGDQDLGDRASAALAATPADQRLALTLHYLDGLGVAEIAKALQRSVHAAESLLARGRENFKKIYLDGRQLDE